MLLGEAAGGAVAMCTLRSASCPVAILVVHCCPVLTVLHTILLLATGGSKYSGAVECAKDVFARDGAIGFMKGWSASYARLGPHTVIMFLTAERLRAYAGLQSL